MTLVLVGLLFVLFRYDYVFYSYNMEMTIAIDVFPDFVGFMLIYFGLDKSTEENRWFKESHNMATGLMVVTFITLLSSLSFLLKPLLNSPDGSIFAFVFALVNLAASKAGSLIFAFTMIFMFTLASAIGYSMQSQERSFSCGLMYFFSIAYIALAIVYLVNQFINLPFSPDWISYPIGALFMISAYFMMNRIEKLR